MEILLTRCDPEAQRRAADPYSGEGFRGYPDCGKRQGAITGFPGCGVDPLCSGSSEAGRAAFAPGRAEHALVWAAGGPVVLGGTSGCVGSGCEAWQSLFDADELGVARLRAANPPFAQRAGGASATLGQVAEVEGDWPAAASVGWRGGAATSIGRVWSPSARAWVGGGERFLLLGGTRAQEVAPGVAHQLACGAFLPNCFAETCELPSQEVLRPRCAYYESDGFTPVTYTANEAGDALLPPVRVWTPGGTASSLSSPGVGLPLLTGLAATRLLDDRVVTLGGTTAAGVDIGALNLIELSGGIYQRRPIAVERDDLLVPRRGAAAELDAVTGRVWLFGGHASDARALWLSPPDDEAPEPGGQELQLSEVELRFSYTGVNPTTATWRVYQQATLDVLCPAPEPDCWSQNLVLVALRPQGTAAPLPLLHVVWENGTSSEVRASAAEAVSQDLEDDPRRAYRFRLPRELVDGDRLRVWMDWEGTPVALPTVFEASKTSGLYTSEFADDRSHTVQWRGPLFTPVSPTGSWDGPRLDDVTRFEGPVPEDWTALAPGLSDHPGPAVGGVATVAVEAALQETPAALRMWWVEGLLPPIRRDDAGIPVHLYAHRRLASVTPGVLPLFQDEVGADLLWLRQRFGPLARAPGPGVLPLNGLSILLRPPSGIGGTTRLEEEVGVAHSGLLDVHQGTPDGRVEVDRLRSTVLHELAHAHLDVYVEAGSRWFDEGVSTLAELVHSPALASHHRLLEATTQEVNRRAALGRESSPDTTLSDDLDPEDLDFRRYSVGAYTLTQWSALRGGAPSAEPAVWALMRAARAQHPFGATLDSAHVAALLDAQEPGFSAAWTAPDRRGVPLLGITAFEHRIDGSVLLRVEQVQNGLLGVPTFDAVPVHLACHQHGAPDVLAWSGCTADGRGPVAERRRLQTQAVELVIPANALSLPASFALLQGAALLPEQQGVYGVIPRGWLPFEPGLIPPPLPNEPVPAWPPPTPTWLTRCAADQVGVHPACRVDTDGDGYPTGGDCDDEDLAAFPDHPDAGEPWVDLNCDGWYAFPGAL